MEHKIKLCDESHLPEILEILNEAILNSTAIYDYRPRTPDAMKTWYNTKKENNYPIIGAFDDNDSLLGFSSYGPFRNWPGYKYTVEHSVYVRFDQRGRGLGPLLLKELIKYARAQNYHVLIGGIDATNSVSIHLHEKEGFVLSGIIRQAGFKFGKWLDLAFYQTILNTPEFPVEDF